MTTRFSIPRRLMTAAAGVLLAGCGHQSGPAASAGRELPAVAVQVKPVVSKSYATTEKVVGTVRAKVHATLEAKLSGRIGEMPVVLGQPVRAGQLLVRLEAAEIKARLEQAQAALAQAERDWKRTSTLFEARAVTTSEYEMAESRQRVARAAVAEAQAMMGYVEVVAPFDGVVTKKWAEQGDQATPGKALLELENPSALRLEADVPEAIVSGIHRGDRLTIRADSLRGEHSGTVSELAPSADPVSRTFGVRVDLPGPTPSPADPSAGSNSPPFLRSGQFARLVVPVGESTSLRVPVSAVVQRGQLELVFVAAKQRAQMHLVKTGKQFGDEVEIVSGLDGGDEVVVRDAGLLTDGQRVEVK